MTSEVIERLSGGVDRVSSLMLALRSSMGLSRAVRLWRVRALEIQRGCAVGDRLYLPASQPSALTKGSQFSF
ncbi:unnamed protein product, partial [Iphiclides podalirius]